MRKLLPAILAPALCVSWPAFANDSMAELKTGGLVLVRSDVVQMEKEDLFISAEEVRVSYQFRNLTDEDVETVVAFPMPDISGDPYSNVAVPDPESDNLLHFSVEVDGRHIEPQLEQKAFALDLDVTSDLIALEVPMNPFSDAAFNAVEALPDAVKRDWVARGIVLGTSWDDGSGMRERHVPIWALKSTYWWRMVFPGGERVAVRHSYQPSVGGTVGVAFLEDGKARGPVYEEYRTKYCLDEGSIVQSVERLAAQDPDGFPPFYENWISYVLTTGANWAGSIGEFRLTIDKGLPGNLVSFCGSGVRKVGPTTFEMVANDFHPTRDLDILILQRIESERGVDAEPEASREKMPLFPQ